MAGGEDTQRSMVGKEAREVGGEELSLPGYVCTVIFILTHNENVPSVLVS